MVRRVAAGVRLLTRNGHDWVDRYPLIALMLPECSTCISLGTKSAQMTSSRNALREPRGRQLAHGGQIGRFAERDLWNILPHSRFSPP